MKRGVVSGAGKVIVLDSWALLAYLDGEPAGTRVRQLLRRARGRELQVLLSLISFGECLYVIEREHGLQRAQQAVGIIDQLALRVVPVDRPLVLAAAHLKARHAISYADAFTAPVALRHRGVVTTGDPEFEALASEMQFCGSTTGAVAERSQATRLERDTPATCRPRRRPGRVRRRRFRARRQRP